MHDSPTVAILGGSLSGNKGAASMTYAVCDAVRGFDPTPNVLVFSPYPTADRSIDPNTDIVEFTPRDMLVRVAPWALLSLFTFRKIRPSRGPAGRLARSDAVADVSGIAFMDGRGMATLVYNVLLVFLPWAFGVPVVKMAQALGPFRTPLNRTAARAALSRVEWIGLRGAGTEENFADLGLGNGHPASDLAFLLDTADADVGIATRILPNRGERTLVVPSEVVHEQCRKEGIDYVSRVVALVVGLRDAGHDPLILAHSAIPGAPAGRTNDLPVCREIASRAGVEFIDEDLGAKPLRAVIARGRMLVTSRFHGMISGLAEEIPTLVIGWSHKYREVLDSFDLADWAVDFRALSDGDLLDTALHLDADRDLVVSRISQHLPAVRDAASVSIEALGRVLLIADAPRATDLSIVVDNDLCIGCGACVAADSSISLVLDPTKQMYQPSGPGNELATAVCPAIGVDYAGLQAERFPGRTPGPFGVVEDVYLAQSTDLERNVNASSGGIIKEYLGYLLEQDDIDGVIALGHVEGLVYEPTLVRTVDELNGLPGSIYHNLTKTRAIDLLRSHEGRFVLVGIPCEFEGIFAYISKAAPELAERIHSTVGLLCGWQYNYHALRAIADFKGIDYDTIDTVSYRGGGPVGKLRISTSDGNVVEVNRRVDFSYQVAFDRHFNTPRCHLCVNHANFLADLVVGDAWLPSTVGTRTGISIVICRTAEASERMKSLAGDGRAVVTEVSVSEIEESQTHRIAFGDFAYPYAERLRAMGRYAPDLIGPNKPGHTPVGNAEIDSFVKELDRKLELQRAGRYRYLRWRKATKELPKFAQKYFRWFFVRILRIKSLTGQRHEVERAKLVDFK